MTRCTWDAELNAALEEDAAKLEAMGLDPGPTLEDLELDECPREGGCEYCWEFGCPRAALEQGGQS